MKKTLVGLVGALMLLAGCSTTTTKCEAFKEVFKQNKVYFATNKAELTEDSKKVLDKQIVWLKDNPEKKVILQGYTDPSGTVAYNMKLGMKRADAVKNYFVKSGISANRVTVVSFGENDLASNKDTKKAWSEDRREMTVIVTE